MIKKKWFITPLLLSATLILGACGEKENNNEESVNAESTQVDEISEIDKIMKQYGVTLTGKDVQYNMVNNLDNQFITEGTLSLCDYYNYGFTNEAGVFCAEMKQRNTKPTESWYMYFHRESFGDLYSKLMNGNVNGIIIAKIPSKAYKEGQGNMAFVTNAIY